MVKFENSITGPLVDSGSLKTLANSRHDIPKFQGLCSASLYKPRPFFDVKARYIHI